MKIGFYISTIKGGGAARVMVALANKFCMLGYRVIFITNFASKDEYSLMDGIIRYNLEEKESKKNIIIKNLIRCKALRKYIKKEEIEIVISFMAENNFRLIFSSLRLKIKKLISVRNSPEKEYKTMISKFLANKLYLKADGIVFQTKDAQKWFPIEVQRKSEIIMNQVDNIFFETLKVSEEYYVATGRLSEQKNYPMMIRAFSKFSKEYPQEKLYIYGEGSLEKELKDLITTLGMKDNIYLMGRTVDIPKVLSKAKGFILSSDYEGMPNGLLEAMAMGVPCISTECPCGGPREIIKNGITGILIPVNGEEELYKSLIKFNQNKKLTNLYAKNGKKRAQLYTPDKIFSKWLKYLNSI